MVRLLQFFKNWELDPRACAPYISISLVCDRQATVVYGGPVSRTIAGAGFLFALTKTEATIRPLR